MGLILSNSNGSLGRLRMYLTIPSSVDPDAQAFITAAGITDSTQQSAINTLVVDLKGYGIWTKMKAIYPFVGGTASTHKWNLKDPRDLDAAFRLVFSGGWTHSSTGAKPNGTNGYADTKLIPSSVLTETSQCSSIYSRSNFNNAGINEDFSAISTSGNFTIIAGLNFAGINAFTRYGSITDVRNTSAQRFDGYFVGSRTANNVLKLWRSNVQLVSTQTTTESGIANIPPFLGAANNSGTASNFCNREYALASIGDGLTDTEAANLYTAVQAYQTTLSRNV